MYTGLKQVCRQKDNAYYSKATKLRREKHTVNSTKFSLTLGFLLTLFIKSSLCQTDDTKREAVVTVKNIFQEVKVFGKVVCPNFLFKMTSRGLSEVKKSVVLTKRHYHLLTMKNGVETQPKQSIRELLIFSGLHILLAFQSV